MHGRSEFKFIFGWEVNYSFTVLLVMFRPSSKAISQPSHCQKPKLSWAFWQAFQGSWQKAVSCRLRPRLSEVSVSSHIVA